MKKVIVRSGTLELLAASTRCFLWLLAAVSLNLVPFTTFAATKPVEIGKFTSAGTITLPDAKDSAEIGVQQLAILGSNSCQNADIRIVNSLDFPITVRSIDYYNGSERRWQHEDLDNKLVTPGAMEFWTPSFSNTKNDLIYSFDVNFDHDEDAAGNAIATHAHDHHINTPDTRCNTGVVYLLDIQ